VLPTGAVGPQVACPVRPAGSMGRRVGASHYEIDARGSAMTLVPVRCGRVRALSPHWILHDFIFGVGDFTISNALPEDSGTTVIVICTPGHSLGGLMVACLSIAYDYVNQPPARLGSEPSGL